MYCIGKLSGFCKRHARYFVFIMVSAFCSVVYAENNMVKDSLTTKEVVFPIVPFTYSLNFKDTPTRINFGRNAILDFKQVATSPFTWKAKDWAILSGITGTAAVLYVWDIPVFESADFLRGNFSHHLSENFTSPLGDYRYQAAALASLYAFGWIGSNEKAKNIAVLSAQALFISGGMTQCAKYFTGRERPHETNPLYSKSWVGVNHHSSFWSGHTSTAFTLAAVFADVYSDKKWVSFTSYGLAGLVGLSRITEDQHWPSDVFVGAAVGVVIGKMVVKNYKNRAVTFSPYYTGLQQGLRLNYTF